VKIKSIAPWFGGKRTMAPEIVKQLGPHSQYFEPFCGSMAVLFAKDQSRQETVNDLHGDLINLAKVIQGPECGDFYERVNRCLVGDHMIDEVREIRQQERDLEPIDAAFWYFVESWMGRNGVAGTQRCRGKGYSLAVRWTAGGGSPSIRFDSAVDSIPAWHERLKNVVILQRDAFEIIPRCEDSAHTAIYVDPPYVSDTRSGYHGSGGQSRYEHEFGHNGDLFGDDHGRLCDDLAKFQKARVVVSYYDCPRVRELYQGWEFIDCSRNKNLHTQNGRGSRQQTAPEILIVNGDPL